MTGIVIIGASHSGVNTAVQLRKLDSQVPITLVSNEAHLPYHRPPLSKQAVFDLNLPIQLLQPNGYFAKHNIDLFLNTHINAIDPTTQTVTLANDTSLPYQSLVLATGTKNCQLNIPGETLAHHLYTYADIQTLGPKLQKAHSIAVIGGGFIGCEIAAGTLAMGKQVNLINSSARLLRRSVAPAIGTLVTQWHQSQGMHIHHHCQCLSITDKGVNTKQGFIAADLVIIGVGATANMHLAQQAGLATQQGILVDDTGKTSNSSIYAVGDVAEFPLHVPFPLDKSQQSTLLLPSIQNATDQAAIVAHNLLVNRYLSLGITDKVLSAPKHYCPVPWFWSDQGQIKLQMAGLTHADAECIVLPSAATNKDTSPAQISVDALTPTPIPTTLVHLLNQQLIAVDTINAPGNHLAARKLLAMDTAIHWDAIKAAQYDLKALYKSLR